MITVDMLARKWKSVTYFNGGFLRLDQNHPLEWYIGYQSINQKTLLIISNSEFVTPASSKSVLVSSRKREIDNRWTLTFDLMRSEQESVFINLCCDILNYSQKANNDKEAIDLVLSRYKQWNRLLESNNMDIMNESSKKGLIGELIFLKSLILKGINTLTVVQAWVGPDGADQDFVFLDKWYEIKTLGISSEIVGISSLQQLDCICDGYLVIVRVDKCSPEHYDSFSLHNLVNDIRELIKSDYKSEEIFEDKLLNGGYIDLQVYENQKYYYSETKIYLVNETFPRIVKSDLPTQIVGCNYTLSIAGISDWEKEEG